MKSITLLFKTHLDIGFTGLAEDVTHAYPGYFRTAVATANYFRAKDPSPSGFRYCWTVGSWLIDRFFEQANEQEKAFLEKAISDGDVIWHAMPFTTESETVGLSAFRAGLGRSADLNRRFGKQVHSAKLTDVPGHTRGIIGPFVEAGITLLHIGTNPGCGVCTLPEAFRWRDSKGREIYVVYQAEYGKLVELPDGHAFLLSVANDNLGAHSPEEVEALLATLKQEHPEAVIRCGTLDDLSDGLDRVRESLPLLTSEIGSTWVHSAGTDPLKMAHYRECLRWAESLSNPAEKERFLRALEIVTEHTGGLDTKTFLHDNTHWSGDEIRALASIHPKTAAEAHALDATDHGFAMSVRSWDEQREYIKEALKELENKADAESLAQRLARLSPSLQDVNGEGWTEFSSDQERFETRHFAFRVDLRKGCLRDVSRKDGKNLFLAAFRVGGEQFSPEDYERYHERYLRLHVGWTHADFGKPGMPSRPYRLDDGFAARLYWKQASDGVRMVLRSSEKTPYMETWETELFFPEAEAEIQATVKILGKDPSRSAHALWCSFEPAQEQGGMSFEKLGEPIDPTDVVEGGGRSLHAIDGVIQLEGGATLETLDAPLLSPGERDLLWAHWNPIPKRGSAFHINLYNNIWGCNFAMWFGDDMAYRFIVKAER